MRTAVNATRGARNPRSDVGNLKGEVATTPHVRHPRWWPTAGRAHGAWRRPHRSRRELAGVALWWLVVAAGLTAGAVYMLRQR